MRTIKKILPAAVAVLLVLTATFAIHFNSHRIFLFFEEAGLFRPEVSLEAAEAVPTVPLALPVLEADARVTFDRSLMLINTVYPLAEDFVPSVTEYKNTDVYMDRSMVEAYGALSAAVLAETGRKLYVSSDLRTAEEQAQLYLEDPTTATRPGASEHQSGLCLDVYVAYFAGDGFLKSPAGRFVNGECHRYGFIIRYPSYGEDETGIRFEPWHIRYVGQPHAEIIYGEGLTLEEYIRSLEEGKWYEAEGYLICRQALSPEGELTLPQEFSSCVISPDNTGLYVLTVKP